MPRRALPIAAVLLSLAAPATAAPNAADYVLIENGKFYLHGSRLVLRGTNYFGSWRFPVTMEEGGGVEQATIWAFFHNWDAHRLDLDFRFLTAQLNATALRIGTPAASDFAALVRYHNYPPWYEPDGSITETYKKKLVALADLAATDHLRIQLCLFWNIAHEIAEAPEEFLAGHRLDRYYAAQLRSIALALRDHPGVMAYSIGNEVLVRWPLNGAHRSPYEGLAGAFITRRLRELRILAPHQLLTDDEIAHPESHQWYAPDPAFAALSAPGNAKRSFRLVDLVDYAGTHFYPEILRPEDLPDDRFAAKLADARQQLALYSHAVRGFGKPIVINEFGLKLAPPSMAAPDYARPRDRLFGAVAAAAEGDGLQGLLAWMALPRLVLRPGHYSVAPSRRNRYSPIEVDLDNPARRVLFCDPSFDLFVWGKTGDIPHPTGAAVAIKSAWPDRDSAGGSPSR